MSLAIMFQYGDVVQIHAESWFMTSTPEKTKQQWEWIGKTTWKNKVWGQGSKRDKGTSTLCSWGQMQSSRQREAVAKDPRRGKLCNVWRTSGDWWISKEEGLCGVREMILSWLVCGKRVGDPLTGSYLMLNWQPYSILWRRVTWFALT